MQLSNEDKALNKNLQQFKKRSLQIILAEFSKINRKRERLGMLLKDSENRKHRPKTRKRQTLKACRYWKKR